MRRFQAKEYAERVARAEAEARERQERERREKAERDAREKERVMQAHKMAKEEHHKRVAEELASAGQKGKEKAALAEQRRLQAKREAELAAAAAGPALNEDVERRRAEQQAQLHRQKFLEMQAIARHKADERCVVAPSDASPYKGVPPDGGVRLSRQASADARAQELNEYQRRQYAAQIAEGQQNKQRHLLMEQQANHSPPQPPNEQHQHPVAPVARAGGGAVPISRKSTLEEQRHLEQLAIARQQVRTVPNCRG
jgi:hypothetical protein